MMFTSESVTSSHPDKLCDQISDAAIDALLRQDAGARDRRVRVATGVVFLADHIAADAVVDLPVLARNVIADVGYVDGPFNARSCSILTSLAELPLETREPPLAAPMTRLSEATLPRTPGCGQDHHSSGATRLPVRKHRRRQGAS